jgi:hypothetical protein
MKNKQQLENEIYKIEQKELKDKEEKRKQTNYKNFLERPSDWVIGKAHCEPNFKDNGWHHPKGRQLPRPVDVHGNCGHIYYPTAWVTEATYIYFHNVWENDDETKFQKALNDVVQKEVERIAKKLVPTLEIMGLQSNYYHLREDYPENKIKSIEKNMWIETKKILDTYSDIEIMEARKKRLSHGGSIFQKYLLENRSHLL